MSDSVPPPIPSGPPPLPRTASYGGPPCPWQGIAGTEGMSAAELQQAVGQGGRFVFYQYAFSVLVMSFKRSSPIMFLPSGQSSFRAQAPYSAISFFFGWWGIPWGPIWTITTLGSNLNGGTDVTARIMEVVSPVYPGAFLRTAPPPPVLPAAAAPPRRRPAFQKALIGLLVVVLLGFGWIGYKVVNHIAHMPPTPGESE